MLWVRSSVLSELVERYDRLTGQSEDVRREPRIQDLIRDTAYTLCVCTGTREVTAALAAARGRIARAGMDTAA